MEKWKDVGKRSINRKGVKSAGNLVLHPQLVQNIMYYNIKFSDFIILALLYNFRSCPLIVGYTLTNSMAYGTCKFNVTFTRALQ